VILFQGDSITDWGRSRTETTTHTANALGNGYTFFAASKLLQQHPAKNLKIYNRGISGNKVYQLAERWQAECLDLKPNVLSILIGVNDYWAIKKHGYTGTIDTYINDYTKLIEQTKQALPDVKLIIGEPFAVLGVKDVTDEWFPAFDEYRKKAKKVANDFDATFIPYQKLYNEALKSAPGSYWTIDGVHPTMAGAALMAEAWLQCVKD
jgi:lysophospholipase L1-like esterase